MKHIQTSYYNFINESKVEKVLYHGSPYRFERFTHKAIFFTDDKIFENRNIIDSFINHYKLGKGLSKNDLPKDIINKFPNYVEDTIEYSDRLYQPLYSGVHINRNIDSIKSFTIDEATAKAFAEKYVQSKIVKIEDLDFINKFNFVSLDVLHDYLSKKYDDSELRDYVSESEIYILNVK